MRIKAISFVYIIIKHDFLRLAISVLLIQYVDVRVHICFFFFKLLFNPVIVFFSFYFIYFSFPPRLARLFCGQGSIYNLFVLHVLFSLAKITLKSSWRLAHYRKIQTCLKRSRKQNL